MARENRSWGYTRIQGALANLRHEVGSGNIDNILREVGMDAAPDWGKGMTWKEFLRVHWSTMGATDFFTVEVWTPVGLVRYHVLFVMRLMTREIHIAGIVPEPCEKWMLQTARNLTDACNGFLRDTRFLIHDRSTLFTEQFREVLKRPIRMVKQFLPHLKTKSEAAIMNVSSGLAFVPLPISPVYCATKAGLHSFTESLRVQLKNTKVKVFDLAPPAIQTELLGGFDVEDMKGASIMKVEDMVQVAVKGMQTDRFEIRPGQANQLQMMSRVAPGFILKQMSRSVDRMLRTQN